MTPRVSVLMTIYNAGPYLAPALDSLLAQTFAAWELIAIENGSSDGSKTVLQNYANQDPRIRVIGLAANIGRTPALVEALAVAQGEYIAVLDADDIAYPARLERTAAYLDVTPDAILVASHYDVIDGNGAPIRTFQGVEGAADWTECLAWINPVAHSAAMYRRAAARAVGGYSTAYAYAQDYALWIALARRGAIHIIPERLAAIRELPASVSRNKAFVVTVYSDIATLLRQAGNSFATTRAARRRNIYALVDAKVHLARALRGAGRPGRSLLVLLALILRHPVAVLANVVSRRVIPTLKALIPA